MVAGLASTIFLPGAALLISRLGWRHALLLLALVQAATVIPHALLLRRRPADHGWQRDGVPGSWADSCAPAPAVLPDPAERAELAAAVRSRPVMLLTAGAVLGSAAIAAVAVLLLAYLRLTAIASASRRWPQARWEWSRSPAESSSPPPPAACPPPPQPLCCSWRPGHRRRRTPADPRPCRDHPVRGLVRRRLRCPEHRPPGPPCPVRPTPPLRAAERRPGPARDRRRGSRADRRRGSCTPPLPVTRPCSSPSPCARSVPLCCSWRPTAPTATRRALSGRVGAYRAGGESRADMRSSDADTSQ